MILSVSSICPMHLFRYVVGQFGWNPARDAITWFFAVLIALCAVRLMREWRDVLQLELQRHGGFLEVCAFLVVHANAPQVDVAVPKECDCSRQCRDRLRGPEHR